MHPDFAQIATCATPIIKKDSKHTLIIFSVVGLAIIGYSWFNPANRLGLVAGGVFFLVIGVVRYFIERSKRPLLMLALVKKKEAIPYTRMPGTFDYYIQVESI